MSSESDFLSRIEAEMRQEGLLRRAKHPQHIECDCRKCKPWEGYTVEWLTSVTLDGPSIRATLRAVTPLIFTVRLKDNSQPRFDSKGRRLRRGWKVGHFVALPDCMPILETEDVRVQP